MQIAGTGLTVDPVGESWGASVPLINGVAALRARGVRGLLISATAAFALAGCTTFSQAGGSSSASHAGNSPAGQEQPTARPYMPVEFAMPAGATIDRDNTLVVGNAQQWFGTLSLTTNQSMDAVNGFYSRELPAEGWEPLASLIANRVVLQFISRERGSSCIVTIENSSLWSNTHVEIVVAPLVTKSSYSAQAPVR